MIVLDSASSVIRNQLPSADITVSTSFALTGVKQIPRCYDAVWEKKILQIDVLSLLERELKTKWRGIIRVV